MRLARLLTKVRDVARHAGLCGNGPDEGEDDG